MKLKDKYTIEDLLAIIRRLREPDGCPWDKIQTHQSIKKSLIEETYEAIDALDFGTDHDFANELGDVLLQVAFHSVLAEERNAFNFDDVLKEVCNKLITRHTHVFGNDHAGSVEESLMNWEKQKKKEKKINSYTEVLKEVPSYLPALMRAEKIQKKAKGFGFDWDDINDVYRKVNEEINELVEAKEEGNEANIREEYGDLLFAVVNLGRFIGADPETALSNASNKFINRFEKMEKAAIDKEKDLAEMNLEELDKLWEKAKKSEPI